MYEIYQNIYRFYERAIKRFKSLCLTIFITLILVSENTYAKKGVILIRNKIIKNIGAGTVFVSNTVIYMESTTFFTVYNSVVISILLFYKNFCTHKQKHFLVTLS